jgi:hypothetical protein
MIKSSSSPIKPLSPAIVGSHSFSSASPIDWATAATVANVWVFDGRSMHALSAADYGVFEVHHLYIVQVIRSSFVRGGVHLHRLYFWIGPNLQQRVLAMSKIISVANSVSEHIRTAGNNCSEVEIVVFENFCLNSNMSHKPVCFELSTCRQVTASPEKMFSNHDALMEFSLCFNKGIFVVNKLSHPTYGLSMPSIALVCVSGRSINSAICTLMKREIHSLHSLANFFIIAPTCILLWYGRWSDSLSRRVALEVVKCHFKNRLFRTFDEGSEPQEFFSYLEQCHPEGDGLDGRVRTPEYLLAAPWWIPKLFACELQSGFVAVKPCPSLEQQFFRPASCMIVDAWVSVFLWVSAAASDTLVSQCATIAEKFVAGCLNRQSCAVIHVHQYFESHKFRDLFVIWRDWPRVRV